MFYFSDPFFVAVTKKRFKLHIKINAVKLAGECDTFQESAKVFHKLSHSNMVQPWTKSQYLIWCLINKNTCRKTPTHIFVCIWTINDSDQCHQGWGRKWLMLKKTKECGRTGLAYVIIWTWRCHSVLITFTN